QHSGQAWTTVANAFVPSYSNDAPAIFTGASASDVHANVNKNSTGQVNIFTKGVATGSSDFVGPIGFTVGSRNNLRGPGYFVMDSGLAKTFAILPDHGVILNFRADFFNVLNHPSFSTPGPAPGANTDITNASFGVITTTASGPRIGQLALRLQF
ncbi:MAG TPA: hypothetical protein VH250_05790, partial [Granulicella sp.]|nr:hypothetical protein [Granulicella sp.]